MMVCVTITSPVKYQVTQWGWTINYCLLAAFMTGEYSLRSLQFPARICVRLTRGCSFDVCTLLPATHTLFRHPCDRPWTRVVQVTDWNEGLRACRMPYLDESCFWRRPAARPSAAPPPCSPCSGSSGTWTEKEGFHKYHPCPLMSHVLATLDSWGKGIFVCPSCTYVLWSVCTVMFCSDIHHPWGLVCHVWCLTCLHGGFCPAIIAFPPQFDTQQSYNRQNSGTRHDTLTLKRVIKQHRFIKSSHGVRKPCQRMETKQ